MKRETFPAARARLLAALAVLGWTTRPGLKVPWAENERVRVWFTAQAVHVGPPGAPQGAARSAWVDTRDLSVAAFLEAVQRAP